MSEFRKWLTHDDQKDLFEVLLAVALNLLFLVLIAVILWPLGRFKLALSLAKGYGLLWIVLYVANVFVTAIQRLFRVNIYDRPNGYVISGLFVSCTLQAGWSAFAAITVHSFLAGAPIWFLVILYIIGILSCLAAFFVVSSFYQGHIYKFVSLPLSLVVFIIVTVWAATDHSSNPLRIFASTW